MAAQKKTRTKTPKDRVDSLNPKWINERKNKPVQLSKVLSMSDYARHRGVGAIQVSHWDKNNLLVWSNGEFVNPGIIVSATDKVLDALDRRKNIGTHQDKVHNFRERKLELEVLQMESELVTVDEVNRIAGRKFGVVRKHFYNSIHRLGPKLALINAPDEMKGALKEAIDDIFEDILRDADNPEADIREAAGESSDGGGVPEDASSLETGDG